jgi:hypothetical protein
MVKEEPQKEVAAPLEIKPEESTVAPAVNQETPSFAPVPIETEKTKPAITEPVKVDEPKCDEPPTAGQTKLSAKPEPMAEKKEDEVSHPSTISDPDVHALEETLPTTTVTTAQPEEEKQQHEVG